MPEERRVEIRANGGRDFVAQMPERFAVTPSGHVIIGCRDESCGYRMAVAHACVPDRCFVHPIVAFPLTLWIIPHWAHT